MTGLLCSPIARPSFRQREKLLRLQCRFIDLFVGMAVDFLSKSRASQSLGPRFEPWCAHQRKIFGFQ
jgi:hypothetical protein